MWSSSPSSSSSPYATIVPAAGKTMDEVWREISTLIPQHDSASRGVIPPPSASPTPPPTLNSTAHQLSSLVLLQPHPSHVPGSSSLKKRLPSVDGGMNSGGAGDRRHKNRDPPAAAPLPRPRILLSQEEAPVGGRRMIKNRESAARSRARKQAYTNELELEVAHLLQENAKLKEMQHQLCGAADAHDQHPKRKPRHRTLSAPF